MKIGKRIRAAVLALCLTLGLCVFKMPETVRAEYGDNAYAFMKQLQSNYPYRAANSSNGMLAGAQQWLQAQIVTMGYEYMTQPFTRTAKDGVAYNGENIIFSKQGASDRVIVIGAHYDCVQQTFGTDDNASGVGVLLELASIYSTKETPYTLRFILFSAEEPGCLGSQHYVENLSQEERDRIVCMINIDTIASGDNMYLYGGAPDGNGNIVRDWAVYQAQSAAELLGINMSFHPDVNDSFPSPTKTTASDQMAFSNAGIAYIYCEASNWNGEPYTNFYQTANPSVAGGTVMHNPSYDNLTFLENTFGTRVYDHLQAYSRVLDYLIEHMQEGKYVAQYSFEDMNVKAHTSSSVYVRELPTRYSQALTLLDAEKELVVTGYHNSWCSVEVDGQSGYVKTEYLVLGEESAEETNEFESEEISEESSEESTDMTAESEYESMSENFEEASENDSTYPDEQESKADVNNSESEMHSAYDETVNTQTSDRNTQDKNVIADFIEQVKNDPNALRIVLIAVIVIVCIWLCVFITLYRRRKMQKEEQETESRSTKKDKSANLAAEYEKLQYGNTQYDEPEDIEDAIEDEYTEDTEEDTFSYEESEDMPEETDMTEDAFDDDIWSRKD